MIWDEAFDAAICRVTESRSVTVCDRCGAHSKMINLQAIETKTAKHPAETFELLLRLFRVFRGFTLPLQLGQA